MFRRHPVLFIFILAAFVSSMLSAQQLPRLAVIPFNPVGVSKADAEVLTSLFETAAVNTRAFEVIEQSSADAILDAQAYSLEACTDEGCAVEIGRLLAAENIVLGKVSKLGEMFIVTAKIIDVQTGKHLRADRAEAKTIEEMARKVEVLAYSLAGLTYSAGGGERIVESFGEILVDTDPEGAELFVNGMMKGTSPTLLQSVPSGKVLLEAKKDGAYASREVDVPPDGLVEVSLDLEASPGRLYIETDDRTLSVYIDGKEAGQVGTGMFKDIPGGEHRLEVRNTERAWAGSFFIEPGSTSRIEVYPAWLGTLRYELPVAAEAYITGQAYTGTIEGSGEIRIPSGSYRVTASGIYYSEWTGTLQVTREEPAVLKPELEFSDSEEARTFLAGKRIEELEAEKEEMKAELKTLRPAGRFKTAGYVSAAASGVCFIAALVNYSRGLTAREAYDASIDAVELMSLRGALEDYTGRITVLTAGGLAGSGVSALLFSQKGSEDPEALAERERIRERLLDIDREIAALKGGAE